MERWRYHGADGGVINSGGQEGCWMDSGAGNEVAILNIGRLNMMEWKTHDKIMFSAFLGHCW